MNTLRKNLERHMNELCLQIGSRHCGSIGEAAAAGYIESVFRNLGVDVVREEYPVRGWTFRSFELWNVTRNRAVPSATACYFSNRIEAEDHLLRIKASEVYKLDQLPVKGRLCFVEFWSGMDGVMGRNTIAEELDRLGAAGAIFISNIHTALAPSTKIERSPFLKTLGVAAVSQEGAFDLARNPDDVYRLKIDAEGFDHRSCNVIARIEKKTCDDKGVFGCHYDTAPLVQGAGDNAAGTAMLLELVRLLKDNSSGWSLDFSAFSAEEYVPKDFPPGSGDYVERHRHEKIRWFLNLDDFGLLVANPMIQIGHREKLPALTLPYDVMTAEQNGDDKPFFHAGIPTIWFSDRQPFHVLHTREDSIDKIDFNKMEEGVGYVLDTFRQLTGEKK